MKSNLLVCLQQLPKTWFFLFFFGSSSPKSNRLCYLFKYYFQKNFYSCWGFCFWIVKDQSFSHPCCCNNSPQLAATVWLLESAPQKSSPLWNLHFLFVFVMVYDIYFCYGHWAWPLNHSADFNDSVQCGLLLLLLPFVSDSFGGS